MGKNGYKNGAVFMVMICVMKIACKKHQQLLLLRFTMDARDEGAKLCFISISTRSPINGLMKNEKIDVKEKSKLHASFHKSVLLFRRLGNEFMINFYRFSLKSWFQFGLPLATDPPRQDTEKETSMVESFLSFILIILSQRVFIGE